MIDKPLVSVCIPCYNAEKTIAKTLDSILAQTYSNVEIIVSDNQSTDGSRETVRGYEKQGVRLVLNPPVKDGDSRIFGPFDNWDHALSQGKGDFLCLYHADDLYEPEIIEKEVRFLFEHPASGAVVTQWKLINENDCIIQLRENSQPIDFKMDKEFEFSELFYLLLKHRHFIDTPTLILRKEVVASVGKFHEEEFRSAADLDYLIRISRAYKLGVINEKLHGYRLSDQQVTAKINKGRTAVADYFDVMHFYIDFVGEERLSREGLDQHAMYLKTDLARCAYHLLLQRELYQAKMMIQNVFNIPWVLHCMKSLHGINILGVSAFVYMLTAFTISGFSRK